MGNVRGIQFPNQKLTAADHRTIIAKAITDGKLNGCALTYSGAVLTIGTGAFLISGGEVSITSAETATFTQTSGYGRLIAEIDLTGTATTETWDQFSWSIDYAATSTGFSELTQEDINTGSGTTYQIEFAVVELGASGIVSITRQLDDATGGGSPDLPTGSTITVTSDEGVIITITRGSKSQSGVVPSSRTISFTVNQSGRYTVTASKTGAVTLTRYVDVLADDTDYPISISWQLYLFKAGEGAKVTFKTDHRDASSVTVGTDYIYLNWTSINYSLTALRTDSAVDTTNYTKLCFEINVTSTSSTSSPSWPTFGICSNAWGNGVTPSSITWITSRNMGYQPTGRVTVEFDLSSISGNYYPAYVGVCNGYIYNIWLE